MIIFTCKWFSDKDSVHIDVFVMEVERWRKNGGTDL